MAGRCGRRRYGVRLPRGAPLPSNNRAEAAAGVLPFRQLLNRRDIEDVELLLFPADQLLVGESLKRLVGMDERHAEGIGDVLLGDRRREAVARGKADIERAHVEVKQKIGGLFQRVAPTDAQQILVKDVLLARGEPRDVEGQARIALVELPELVAREDAKEHVGKRLDGVAHLVEDRGLQPDEIAGQGEVHDLPPPVRQHLVAKGPAEEHRVEVGAASVLLEDGRARIDVELAGLEAVDEG